MPYKQLNTADYDVVNEIVLILTNESSVLLPLNDLIHEMISVRMDRPLVEAKYDQARWLVFNGIKEYYKKSWSQGQRTITSFVLANLLWNEIHEYMIACRNKDSAVDMYAQIVGNSPKYFKQDLDQKGRSDTTVDEPTQTDQSSSTPQPLEKEIIMAVVNIETKTYVRGTDVTQMSDADLWNAVRLIEAEIDALDKTKTKSKKLEDHIAALKADIEAINALVDAR